MSSWLASSVTSPSRRGPEQRNTAYSPASGMPRTFGDMARPAEVMAKVCTQVVGVRARCDCTP
eukprot:7010290-Prymnesium_polylepis.1